MMCGRACRLVGIDQGGIMASNYALSKSIARVLSDVRAIYGHERVRLYGCDGTEEYGTCFVVSGIPATFSVHTRDGALEDGRYDVQIEGVPPGEYLYTAVVDLRTLLSFIVRMAGPEDEWPNNALERTREG